MATDLVESPRRKEARKGPSRGSSGRTAITRTRSFRVVTLLVGFFVLWQLLATYVITSELVFTSPISVGRYIVTGGGSGGTFATDVTTSAVEFAVGFGAAIVIGILLGLILGANTRLRLWSEPLLNGLYATPMLAIAPVLIVFLGIGVWPKFIIVFLECVFPIITGGMVGVATTNVQLVEAGAVYGARGWKAIFKVYLPSAIPNIVGGLRLAVGRGVIGVIVAELFGSTAGLGHNIWSASQSLDMPALYSSVFILAAASVGGMSFLSWVHKRIAPWESAHGN